MPAQELYSPETERLATCNDKTAPMPKGDIWYRIPSRDYQIDSGAVVAIFEKFLADNDSSRNIPHRSVNLYRKNLFLKRTEYTHTISRQPYRNYHEYYGLSHDLKALFHFALDRKHSRRTDDMRWLYVFSDSDSTPSERTVVLVHYRNSANKSLDVPFAPTIGSDFTRIHLRIVDFGDRTSDPTQCDWDLVRK
jgi:hypothetical protein